MQARSSYPFVYIPDRTATRSYGRSQDRTTRRESNASPAGGVIPVLYGGRRIPGLFTEMSVSAGTLIVKYILCEGPIEAIGNVYIDDKLSTDYGAGVTVTKYLGSSAQADPYKRVAYIVLQIAYFSTITSLPTVEALVSGRKVYDPRLDSTNGGSGTHRLADETTWAYSKCPALHLSDLLMNSNFGGRISSGRIDWSTVASAATRCDTVITTPAWPAATAVNLKETCTNDGGKKYICITTGTTAGAGGPTGTGSDITDGTAHWRYAATVTEYPRHQLNYYWGDETTLQDAIDCIRRHCLGVITFDSGLYQIKIQQPYTGTTETFNEVDVWDVQVQEIQSQDILNRVAWTWTDPTTWEVIDDYLEDPNLAATDEIHEGSYDFTGCTSLDQSRRLAMFMLNSRLSDLPVQFKTHNARGLQPLDVFYLIHSMGGWTAPGKLFQAMSIEPGTNGTTIVAREYDPAVYSSHVMDTPTYTDTSLPGPDAVPADVTGQTHTWTQVNFPDGTGYLNLKIGWTASASLFVEKYRIYYSLVGYTAAAGTYTYEGEAATPETAFKFLTTFPLYGGWTIYIKVVPVTIFGVEGAGAVDRHDAAAYADTTLALCRTDHDHTAGNGAQIDHVNLSNKGTNTHGQIDTFVASKAAASGLASLDASSVMVQPAKLILSSAAALATTEGATQWHSTRKTLLAYDSQRERALSTIGWLPYAYPIGLAHGATLTGSPLAANGYTMMIPVFLPASMLLQSVSAYSLDTTGSRTWNWFLYAQYLNNGNAGENTLALFASGTAAETFTATAASIRTIAAASAPVYLPPGCYWLAFQSQHATSTFSLGFSTAGSMNPGVNQQKQLTVPLGATLDFVAATWAKGTGIPGLKLNGRVFGQTTAF